MLPGDHAVRAALLFVLQPILSGLFACLLVAACVAAFRPKRPGVRAALWLLPLCKIVIDLAAACPVAWVVSQGVVPERIQKGERLGTISVGLSGPVVPLFLFSEIRLEYDAGGGTARGPAWDLKNMDRKKMEKKATGLLHPGDLLYAQIGRGGTLALLVVLLGVGVGRVGLRTVRLFAFRRWLNAQLDGARPLEGHDFSAVWPRPTVLVVPGLAVPFATGFLKPRVMIPDLLTGALSREELAALLAHELAHLRRADPLVRVLAGYLTDVFWYVPGLSGCVRRFQAEREADCDDAARHADEPTRLARALIKTHAWIQALRPEIPGLAPSWAPAAVEASTLAMRLRRLVLPAPAAGRSARVLAALGWAYAASVVLRSSLAGLS